MPFRVTGMQAVILAAGRGTRMGDLTKDTPKPMLTVGLPGQGGKNLLELKLEILPESVDEVIFVVGYFNEKIREFFGAEYMGKKITYVEQKNPTGGTADALWTAKDLLKDKFLVMMGDDLYSREDIEKCMQYEWAHLVDKVYGSRKAGLSVIDDNDVIQDIIEGDHDDSEWWVGTNMFILDTRIFTQTPVPKAEGSSEVGLPQTILVASRAQGIPLHAVYATFWIQITAPEDLMKAEEALKKPSI
jgi:UDP-N-acetylglucosamine diphosphorylase / glucose-1-phosphate thymidylyltransferase / UDP-N-acetylgalactosamine diphosphorylase / glucosamine-1-phosphate N-acetyltransferase / galactosamine-1-phosphate N-acetyltransferase